MESLLLTVVFGVYAIQFTIFYKIGKLEAQIRDLKEIINNYVCDADG